MIIKFTVHDNDFKFLIDKFFNKFLLRLLDIKINKDDFEEMSKWIENYKKINEILNPNNNKKLTLEDKELIITKIKESFSEFIKENKPDSFKYLTENVEVSIINSMTDRWENGEVWYWFQHSNSFINQ